MKLSSLKRRLDEEITPTNFVGGVFPRKHVSIVSSAPGVGKTWFLLKVMLDLSIGGTIFTSLAHHQPAGKTLFLCGEAGIEMMVERTKLLNIEYNQDNIAIYTASDFAQNNIDISLDNAEGMRNFTKIVAGEVPDLVIIDTLISFRNDDENASKETSRLFRKLIGVADKYNCAIVISHHVRKRKTAERDMPATQDEIIGSSAITRLSGVAFMLSRAQNAQYTKLECVKSWWNKPPAIYWRIRNKPSGEISIEYAETDNITDGRLRCEEYIRSMQPNEGTTVEALSKACSSPIQITEVCLQEAVKGGILSKRTVANTTYYFVSK